jgi:hypothetical protein
LSGRSIDGLEVLLSDLKSSRFVFVYALFLFMSLTVLAVKTPKAPQHFC